MSSRMPVRLRQLFGAAAAVCMVLSLTTAAHAQYRGLGGRAECAKKDADMLDKHGRDIKAFIKKHKSIFDNEAALLKNDPQRFCRWMNEAATPFREAWKHQLEARQAGPCGRDPIMDAMLYVATLDVINSNRRSDSICSGVVDY